MMMMEYVVNAAEKIKRIAENEPNPEKAKQLVMQFLRESKEKMPEDLKE